MLRSTTDDSEAPSTLGAADVAQISHSQNMRWPGVLEVVTCGPSCDVLLVVLDVLRESQSGGQGARGSLFF